MRAVDECYRGEHVRVFRLDRRALVTALRKAAKRLLEEHPEVLEVRLFGSLARGDAMPGSDADLLVVLEASPVPFVDRAAEYARHFSGLGPACDAFPYTRPELATLRRDGSAFLKTVWKGSKVLARRTGTNPPGLG